MVLHHLPKSYQGFMTTVTAGERSRPLTFDKLAPLLEEKACELIYNRSEEKALTVKDKGGKGKPKDS